MRKINNNAKNNWITLILFMARMFVFFLIFFFFQRNVNLLFNIDKINNQSFGHIFLAHFYGLPLDISATGYFMFFITIFLIINVFIKKKFFVNIINGLNIVFIALCTLIYVIDAGLIDAWGTKLNTKALSYLSYPDIMLDAISGVNYIRLILLFVIQTVLFILIYQKFVKLKSEINIQGINTLVFIPLIFIEFIAIRGGLTGNTIGKSSAIYSNNPTLNFSAINGFWNFSQVVLSKNNEELVYNFFQAKEASEIFTNYITPEKDTTLQVFSNLHPNILIIFLESFNPYDMKSFGGEIITTPFLDSLSKTGIIFTNFYATGTRTEQGFISVLSSFPAQPKFSVQRESGKVVNLPIFTQELAKQKYNMDFYYGGDLKYARTDEYLKIGCFENLYSNQNFGHVEENEKGVYDEFLFESIIDNNISREQPFLTLVLTSSTHGPYYYRKNMFGEQEQKTLYENALWYTDDCLKNFIAQAKKYNWYKNTLFVILADHTHGTLGKKQYNEPDRFRIPLIMAGEVIKKEFRGMRYEKPSSQIDIAATILNQLNVPDNRFEFSSNLFNPYERNFAFYTFDNGFGYVDENDTIVYDCDQNMLNTDYSTDIVDSDKLNAGKSMLQSLMQRFIYLE